MFNYDSTGMTQTGNYAQLPEGSYILEIEFAEEKVSKKGDPMVTVDFKVWDGEHKGKQIRYHNVTFLGKDESGKFRPGAGFAIHFVKCIGEPWEGDILVDPMKWIGKKLVAKIIQEKDSVGIIRNKIQFVSPLDQKQQDEVLPF